MNLVSKFPLFCIVYRIRPSNNIDNIKEFTVSNIL